MPTHGEPAFGALFLVGLPREGLTQDQLAVVKDLGLRHFIFFREHFASAAGFQSLLARLREATPLGLLAVDQEGGPVARLRPPLAPELKAPLSLAQAADPPQAVVQEARLCARILKRFGLNFNLAPVLDLAGAEAPDFLRARTFGEDPALVSRLGALYVETFLSEGLLCCAKHFPGLGGVRLDPHQELPTVAALRAEALWPFRKAVEAGVPAVMTTHLVVEAFSPEPATFSAEAVRLLREELGFGGVVLTDDLDMGAIVRHWSLPEAILKAFWAGHDLVLLCQNFERAVEAIKEFLREASRSPALSRRLSRALARVNAAGVLYR